MNAEREARLAWLREKREQIERRIWADQQELRSVYIAIAAEVAAEAEGR
ncbi:hypothetical protein [Pseudonocardia sp. NPDC049154]